MCFCRSCLQMADSHQTVWWQLRVPLWWGDVAVAASANSPAWPCKPPWGKPLDSPGEYRCGCTQSPDTDLQKIGLLGLKCCLSASAGCSSMWGFSSILLGFGLVLSYFTLFFFSGYSDLAFTLAWLFEITYTFSCLAWFQFVQFGLTGFE